MGHFAGGKRTRSVLVGGRASSRVNRFSCNYFLCVYINGRFGEEGEDRQKEATDRLQPTLAGLARLRWDSKTVHSI